MQGVFPPAAAILSFKGTLKGQFTISVRCSNTRCKVDCNFLSMTWRKMLWILKYILVNNKYTSSSSGVCYIMRKECIPNIPAHCFKSSLLLCVCFWTSHYVYVSFWSQSQIWRACLFDFIIQVWLKILSWNFVQVSRKYTTTPSKNITNIQLTMPFHWLVSYSQLFSGHLVYKKNFYVSE